MVYYCIDYFMNSIYLDTTRIKKTSRNSSIVAKYLPLKKRFKKIVIGWILKKKVTIDVAKRCSMKPPPMLDGWLHTL